MANPDWKPGQSGNPNGRPKGKPNNVTAEIRKAYELLIHNNVDQMSVWLNDIAQENPEKAFDIIIRLSPFVLPKKQEISADENFQPIQLIIPPKPKTDE
jgi:hypothetical protein